MRAAAFCATRNMYPDIAPPVKALISHSDVEKVYILAEDDEVGVRLPELCEIVNVIKQKRLRLVIVGSITVDCRTGQIDPMSQAFIQMSAVFAELELSIIRARVRSGMQNAKAKGKKIGRPRVTKEDIPAIFYKHYPAFVAGKLNVSELARVCGVSRPTVYKYLSLLH